MKTALLFLIAIVASMAARAQTVDLKDGGGAVLSTHASITAAYAAIPATLTQAYVIELKTAYVSTTETFPIVFTPKAGASAANTITIRPALGVTGLTITGSTGSTTALLKLDDADWIIVDGRPGGTGTTRGLTIYQTGTSTTAYGVWLINGATHNAFRWCIFNGYSTASGGGKCIYINTSASNPTGNSENAFEYLQFIGGRTSINSSGTDAANNNNLRIYGCEFLNTKFAGFWGMSGTGHTTIDSNTFHSTTSGTSGTSGTGCFAILYDFLGDTAIITRNKIYDFDNGSYTTDVHGIIFRSFDPYPSYSRIVNNFISLNAPNSSSDEVHGITYGTNSFNNPHVSDIHFNSVYIGGTATAGTAGNVNSSALYFDATNAGSTFNISNNLFVNARTGGAEDHLGTVYVTQNGTISRSNNTYNAASGNIARVAGTTYNTVASYAAAVSSETGSNAAPVQFVSTSDLHLTGTSVGDPNLAGIAVAGVTTDIDGDARATPYRGADEAASLTPCSGTPNVASITGPATPSCAGTPFTLSASGQSTGPGISYYWQSRPAGSTGAWNAITGATTATLTTSVTVATEFRFVDSCANSNLTAPSNVLVITPLPLPTVTSISEAHALLLYTFGANGAQNVVSYSWDFGDGSNPSTQPTPSHTYTIPGTYTVTLTVTNACGSTTTTLNINAQTCNGAPVSTAVFRSDSTLCPVEAALLHVIFAGADQPSASGLAVQWQSSPDGTTGWTPIAGATDDSLTVSPSDTTYYRYVLTCGSSTGGSSTSAVVAIYTLQAANVAGITSTNTGLNYTFTAIAPQGTTNYSWTWGDGSPQVNGTTPTQTHTFTGAGPYTVTLRATGPCGADTVTLTITPTAIDDDAQVAAATMLYPNPARATLAVRSAVALEEVSVLDMKGAVVLRKSARGLLECTADVRSLAAGGYILRVQTARGVVHLPWQKL